MNHDPLSETYHTHTVRCRHAEGDVAAYCQAAVAKGAAVLGFTDHTPLPDARWQFVRMAMSELPDYCAEIDAAREHFPQLRILKGLECEFAPEYQAFYREELLGTWGMDYLISGSHWFPYKGEWVGVHGEADTPAKLTAYADYLITGMASGLFAFVAHPDLFGCSYPTWDANAEACSRDIIAAAVDLNVPLEINGYGLRKPYLEAPEGLRPKYPLMKFWDIAGEYEGLGVVISSDAHRPRDVLASLQDCLNIADARGLTLCRPVELATA